MAAVFVYVTVDSKEAAWRIARIFVEERLAACANMIDRMHSLYRWREKIEEASEIIVIAKTRDDLSACNSHTGHGLRLAPTVRSARKEPKSVASLRSRLLTPRAGRRRETRRAERSRRQDASDRLSDAMHRTARPSCPVGGTAPRRPWPV